VDIQMPQLGETVTEGTITRWLKSVGDHVDADEPLFEVSTDKVDSEVPAPASGTLSEILVQEGETAEVGTLLAVISDGAGTTTSAPPAQAAAPPREPAAPTAPPPPQPARPARPTPTPPPRREPV
jgi:pyruvate dehydrogenase E2 component (dihydrolipoamide acetyltransferase)